MEWEKKKNSQACVALSAVKKIVCVRVKKARRFSLTPKHIHKRKLDRVFSNNKLFWVQQSQVVW